jgi:hypothetical protein
MKNKIKKGEKTRILSASGKTRRRNKQIFRQGLQPRRPQCQTKKKKKKKMKI